METVSSTDPKTQNNQVPSKKLSDSSPLEELGDSDQSKEGGNAEGEDEGECGFCLFMKGGGCKDSFIAWEDCVEQAEKNNEDIVTKCMEVTSMLKKCMDEHSDYYQPILAAEKAAEAEVKKELVAEKNKEKEEISEEEVVARKLAEG